MMSQNANLRRAPARGGGDADGATDRLHDRLEQIAARLEGQLARLAAAQDQAERPKANKPETELQLDLLRAGVTDIGDLIAQTRTEIAGLTPSDPEVPTKLTAATGELDEVVGATEKAAVQIMAATEQVQDAGARLRALPDLPDAAFRELDLIDASATDVFMACSFQDLTGQRIRRVVSALTYVEARVKSLAALWPSTAPPPPDPKADTRPDAHLMVGPMDNGLEQNAVDNLFGAAVTAAVPAVASQDDIDNLFG